MKKIAVFLAAALVAASAFATITGVGNSYVIANGTWYDCSGGGHSAFNGYDLGELTSLTLGAELTIWADNVPGEWKPAEQGWSYSLMGYKITTDNNTGSAGLVDGGLVLTATEDNQGSFKTQNTAANSVDISGLTDNTKYYLQVWFGGIDEKWDSNNNNNYIASFTKVSSTEVPEPATMSLLGLGALALALRRKLRK